MELIKTFASAETFLSAGIHQLGTNRYLVRLYDRNKRVGLVKTISTPSYPVALRLAASHTFDLKNQVQERTTKDAVFDLLAGI